jgi:putative DNA primase/helicase
MTPSLSLADVIDQFRRAMLAAGLEPPDQINADGKRQRWRVAGDRAGSQNGWLVLYADGVPAGAFGCWKRGISETWRADIGRELSADEQAAVRDHLAAMAKAREAEQAAARKKARAKAAELWGKASPQVKVKHPYLLAKKVRAYGLRQLQANLFVPVYLRGELAGLQIIAPDGSKKFLTGTQKAGAFLEIEGAPDAPDVTVIAEGYATAATIREATGWRVVVAFDAGNLAAVAKAVRAARPSTTLVLAADNDHRTDGNPGLTKARAAAEAVGGIVCVPEFAENSTGSDFNDYAAQHGLQAVSQAFAAAMAGKTTTAPQNAPAAPAGASGGAAQPPTSPPAAGAPPPERDDDDAGEHFEVTPQGVFWNGRTWDKDARRWREVRPLFVCSPLHVVAVTRDTGGSGFGRLVSFTDLDGRQKELVLPSPLFAGGKGDELRGKLMSEGLPRIALEAQAQRKLMEYLMHTAPPVRARCVSRVGWHGDVYVLPREAFGGDGAERYFFDAATVSDSSHERAGTLANWIKRVAKPAGEHPRAMFAIACAFAGPLIDLAGAESNAMHIVGGSSSGKSTALGLAASVWGHPARWIRKWNITQAGLEAAAEEFNDSLFCLDEIGEADPKIISAAIYMLGGSRGKQRANREGGARAVRTFRVMVLSTGEVGSAAMINDAGGKARAGHEVRMVEIPADAGKGCGLFISAGGHSSVDNLREALIESTSCDYGHAGPQFVARIARDRTRVAADARVRVRSFMEYVCPRNASGQVQRVARRFGLVALAGELATDYGLTGWRYEDVGDVVADIFNEWLLRRGTAGAKEPADMIAQVKRYIEEHGGAQFQEFDRAADGPGTSDEHESRVINRAGWRRQRDGSTLYLCYVEKFRGEICKGFDWREVVKALDAAGILVKKADDRYTYKHRVPNAKAADFYALDGDMLYGYRPD